MDSFHTTVSGMTDHPNPVIFFHGKRRTITNSNVAGAEIDPEGLGAISFLRENVESPFEEGDLRPRFQTNTLNLSPDELEFPKEPKETDHVTVQGWTGIIKSILETLTPKLLKNKPDEARSRLASAKANYKSLASACTVSYDYETLIEATKEINDSLLERENTEFTNEAKHFNGLCFVALCNMLNHYFQNHAPEYKEWHTAYFRANTGGNTEEANKLESKKANLEKKLLFVQALESGEELTDEQREVAEKLQKGEGFSEEDRRFAEQLEKCSKMSAAIEFAEKESDRLTILAQGEVVEKSRELLPYQMGFLGANEGFGFHDINEHKGVALVIYNTKEIKNDSGTVMAEKGSKVGIYLNTHSSAKHIDFAIERLLKSNPGIERKDLQAVVVTNGDNERIHGVKPEREKKLRESGEFGKYLGDDVAVAMTALHNLRANGIAVRSSSLFEKRTPNSFVINEHGAKKGRAEVAHPDANLIKTLTWLGLKDPNAMNIAFKDMSSPHNPVMISPHYGVDPKTRSGAAEKFIKYYNAHTQSFDLVSRNKGIPPHSMTVIGNAVRAHGNKLVELFQSCEQALGNGAIKHPNIKLNRADPTKSKLKTRRGPKTISIFDVFDQLTESFRKFLFPVFFGEEADKHNSSILRLCQGANGKKPLALSYHPKNGLTIEMNERDAAPLPRTLLKKAEAATSHPEEVFATERQAFGMKQTAKVEKT